MRVINGYHLALTLDLLGYLLVVFFLWCMSVWWSPHLNMCHGPSKTQYLNLFFIIVVKTHVSFAAFLFLISSDPNWQVRIECLRCIAPTKRTLHAMIDRTRDVNEVIRRTAYHMISEKVSVKALSISQRLSLLESGLADRSCKFVCYVFCKMPNQTPTYLCA